MAHMVCFINVWRALWGVLQVGATLRWVHVSGSYKEALEEGALTCSMHSLSQSRSRSSYGSMQQIAIAMQRLRQRLQPWIPANYAEVRALTHIPACRLVIPSLELPDGQQCCACQA